MRRVLELRAKLNDALRRFFRERGFLEVDTPVVLAANAPEPHIDAIPAGAGWLRTSPELHMKRLLAAGYENLFQLGPCGRDGEHGRWHHPEFAMLEWYRANAGYIDILADAKRGQEDVTTQWLQAESGLRISTRRDDILCGLYIGTRTSAERLEAPHATAVGASPPWISRL